MFNMMTLDGFFEGPSGDLFWHNVDAEFNEFAIAQLNSADGILFGRKTYEMMASYWPSEAAITDDPIVAGLMNKMPKFVLSRTLTKAEWNNTKLIKGNIAEEITKLKQQPGKDLLLFGSADLASTLTSLGLIGEYRIMVNPVVLGNGAPLFKGVKEKLQFKLVNTKMFRSGNVLLYYQPNRK